MLDYIRLPLNFIFAICIMYMLLDCEIKYKKNRYLFWLYVSGVLIFDGFILINYGYVTFMELYPPLVHLPAFSAFVFVSRFKFIKVLFVQLTLVALAPSITMVGLIFAYSFGFNMEIANVFCFIMYPPIVFLFYRYLRPSFLYMLRNTDKGWYGFCTIPLSYTLLIYLISKYNINIVKFEPRTFVSTVLILILTFAAYVLIFRFFRQTREQLNLQKDQDLLKMQVAAAKMHLEELKESQEKTIIYRHDMRHHLNLIGAYLADNNREAAQEYILDVEKTIEGVVVEKYCSNYTVNLILYSYIVKAKEAGIKVETQIDLPEINTVSDMDLCVIFSNAIENAVNACTSIASGNDKTIKIVCKTKNDKLFIQITNSHEGTVLFVDEMPISTKENHGLGTKSIAAVAQTYGGVYSFTEEDGFFKTSIIL